MATPAKETTMATPAKESPPTKNLVPWEAPKPEKKDWRVWSTNLIKRRTTKQLIEDALLTRFKDKRAIEEKFKREFFAKKMKEMLILRTQQRDIIFEKFHASMHAYKLKEQYGIAMQKALRASWHDILGLQFFAEEKDEKRRMKMQSMIIHFDKKETEEFTKDIEEFETKTGLVLGGEEAPPAAGDAKKKPPPAKAPPPSKKMSKTAIKPVEQPPFDPLDPKLLEEQAKAAKAFILEIKERKHKEFFDMVEAMKKQRQDMLEEEEQKRAIEEEEAMKKSEEDAVIREALEKVEAEKQQKLEEEQKAARDAWEAQQKEMNDKARADYDLIQAAEHESYMMYFNDVAEDINKEYDSWQAEIQAKRKKRWQKHYDFCLEIILQFVSMAECINEYRLEVGKNLPNIEFREWKNLFVKGALLPAVVPRPSPPIEPPSEKELRIAKEESESYLDETGEYKSPEGVEPIGKNKELGKFLVTVHEMATCLAEPFQQPDLSPFTLKISVVGMPNSGSEILWFFNETEEEKIRAELIAQPPSDENNNNGKSNEEILLERLSPKARFGLQAKKAAENNIQVLDDVIANLMLLTMLHPEEYLPPSESNAAPALAKGAPAKGAPPPAKKKSVKGAPPSTPAIQQTGYILDGFPQTRGQVGAIEKCLTGLDFEAQEARKEKASKIAPPPPPEVEIQENSGMEMYILVEGPPRDELIKKLSLSSIDPTTNIVYHPLTNPVPAGDKTGIAERLQALESEEQILSKIDIAEKNFQSLQDILKKLNNVHIVPQQKNEDGSISPSLEKTTQIITTFIDEKSKNEAENSTADIIKLVDEASIQAQNEVDIAKNAARSLAEIFFKEKFKEVEAEAAEQALNVDAPPAHPKATKAPPPPKAAKATPPIGNNTAIAKMLDEVTKIVLEVETAANASIAAAEEAKKHVEASKASQGSLEATNICKEEVQKLFAVVSEAFLKAKAASEKCVALLESAKVLVSGEPPPPPPPPQVVPEAEPPVDTLVVKPPPDLELVKRAELGEMVHKIWDELEKRYLAAIQEGFRLLIHERERTILLLIEEKRKFVKLLGEDNGKQELFEDFQERWNRIEPPHQCQKKMIKRLYEEGMKFGELLRSLAYERLQNGKHVEQQSLEDLLDERTSTFTFIFTMLVQAELDRHIDSCSLLHEFYTKKLGSKFSKQFLCDLSTTKRQPSWRFEIPTWLKPLEGSFPEFHMVLSEALAKATNILDVIAGRGSGGNKLQLRRRKSRRLSGRRLTWMRATIPSFREIVHVDLDVKPVFANEHQIFYYRLELLARFACKYLEDLQPVFDGAWGDMDDWLTRRCEDESNLVEEVRDTILESAQESVPLWYRIWMESEFKVEEDKITQVIRIPPEPIIDLTPWHIKVMESIVDTFKSFKSGFGLAQDVTKTTLSAIDNVYMMWRNAPQNQIYPRLLRYKSRRYGHFQHWANLTHDIIEQSKGEHDPRFTSVIEWRGFLVSLVDAQFDYIISSATIEDIVQARTDFFMVVTTKQRGDPSKGCITLDDFLNIRLWFDKVEEENCEDEKDLDDVEYNNSSDESYNLARALKIYIFSLLEKSNQQCRHKTSGLPWQTLLLYLCRDACFETALRKAFTVLANNMSPDEAELNPEELIQVLYPSGVDGAIEVGCITWTIDDMEDVLFRAGIEKATPYVEPKTVPEYINSDSEVPYEKDTIEQFFESRSSSHESQMNENEIGIIEEFLSNVPDTVPSSERTYTPYQESEEEIHFGPQAPIPKRLTVEDCISLSATAKLCGALAATFRQHSVHVMQIAPKKA